MINHVSVGTNDTRRARAFYEPLFAKAICSTSIPAM
jgi:predicted enzyme related to lactoylglutathione lyase